MTTASFSRRYRWIIRIRGSIGGVRVVGWNHFTPLRSLEVIRDFMIIHHHHYQLYHFYSQNKSAALAPKIIQQTNPQSDSYTIRYRCSIYCSSNCWYLFLLESFCRTLGKEYNGIFAVILSKGNLPNPFGVRRAPSEPVSVFRGLKIPRQILTLENTPKTPY